MKRKLLLSALIIGVGIPASLCAQAPELLGSYSVPSGSDVFVIEIARPDEGRGTSIDLGENSIALHRMSALDILEFLVGKIEPCAADEACNFRRKTGVPYLFFDLDGSVFLPRGMFQLSSSCSHCPMEEVKEATLAFLLERLSLKKEQAQAPVYSVCQDVPSFLAHFHSGEDNYSNFQVRRVDIVGDYLEIRHATLHNVIGYLSQRTNSLFRFDPGCSYYSLAYTKPFRILKEGDPRDIISDFAEHHFLKIEKLEGEYGDAIVIKPL